MSMTRQYYETLDYMWYDTIDMLFKSRVVGGTRNGDTREVLGYSARLESIHNAWLWNPVRNLSPQYACAEMLWYLSGTDDISMLLKYAPSYKQFAGKDNKAHGAYGKRLSSVPCNWYSNQLQAIHDVLKKHPESRQAVVSLWNTRDLVLSADDDTPPDMPCTLTWQFLLRDERLHMVVNMRSNDVWLGMPYDVFCFTSFQGIMAAVLGVEPGSYTHNVGSMHLYEKNFVKARQAIEHKDAVSYKNQQYNHVSDDARSPGRDNLCDYFAGTAEDYNTALYDVMESMQAAGIIALINTHRISSRFMKDLVYVCATKHFPYLNGSINSKLLRKAVDDHSRRIGRSGQDDAGQGAATGA